VMAALDLLSHLFTPEVESEESGNDIPATSGVAR
jgi:hypothetical protein